MSVWKERKEQQDRLDEMQFAHAISGDDLPVSWPVLEPLVGDEDWAEEDEAEYNAAFIGPVESLTQALKRFAAPIFDDGIPF